MIDVLLEILGLRQSVMGCVSDASSRSNSQKWWPVRGFESQKRRSPSSRRNCLSRMGASAIPDGFFGRTAGAVFMVTALPDTPMHAFHTEVFEDFFGAFLMDDDALTGEEVVNR